MEKAVLEYPSNYEFMWELAHALSHKKRDERDLAKIIALCEKIVEDCREETLRHRAIRLLCLSYASNNELQKALNLIDTVPDELIEKQYLLEMVLTGEEKIKQAIPMHSGTFTNASLNCISEKGTVKMVLNICVLPLKLPNVMIKVWKKANSLMFYF